MKLYKNSWHSWVYQFIYGFNEELPTNLCPYFWKLIFALILFIPFFLIEAPLMLCEFIVHGKDKTHEYFFEEGIMTKETMLIVSILFNVALFFVFSMVFMWFRLNNNGWITVGVIGYIILIIAVLLVLKENGFFERKHQYDPCVDDKGIRPNIIVEFIKAKYKKYCPKIDWE